MPKGSAFGGAATLRCNTGDQEELEFMASCPECDRNIDVDKEHVHIGDSLYCDDCGSGLLVVSADPLELELVWDDESEDEDEEDSLDLIEEDELENEQGSFNGENLVVGYKCDVCGVDIASKANGKKYQNQEVCTCPGYWEVVTAKQKALADMLGSGAAENAYGVLIQHCLQDQSGFTVCEQCSAMISTCDRQLMELGLGRLKSVGVRPRDQILVVAGVVWQRTMGDWPTCLDESVRRIRDGLIAEQTKGPWWKFWK